MSLKTPTTHPHLFFSANYRCANCSHESEIFIDKDYDFYNISIRKVCACCKEVKDNVCEGDLILRKDWPDPDNDPWQLQCAFILDDAGYCADCKEKYINDYKNLIVSCSKCDGDSMVFKND
jgi:DNA-directed RNA polymerase subunit RPC12/RpoP